MVPSHLCPYFLSLFSSRISVNPKKNLIELSLLPSDTGKPDVFSASPEPPLPKQEGREGGTEKGLKGESKRSQRRREKNQKMREESGLYSQEKKEPRKSQRGGQSKRERQESESEQVSPFLPRLSSPVTSV